MSDMDGRNPRSTRAPHKPAAARPRDLADEQLALEGTESLDVLYRRHEQMVYRYCLGLLRKPEAAADAAQSTWMQATVALSSQKTVVRNVRAWLRTIARNECLDVLRANSSARTQDISTLELSAGTSTEDAFEIRERLRSLLVDLDALSARQRGAIVLRELCGLNAAQLADEFETTPQRASGLVADARRTLTERRCGRLMSCTAVTQQLLACSHRSSGIRAHLEVCTACKRVATATAQELV